MIALTAILGLVIAGLLYLYWYQTRSNFAELLNKFPSPPYKPFIGHIGSFSSNAETLFPQVRKLLTSYNQTFAIWSGYIGSLQIISADDAEIILSSMNHIDKSIIYHFLGPWLGTGLLTSTGAKWKNRRKILTPTFHFNILRRFVDIFGEHTNTLIKKIKQQEVNETKTNVIPLITQMTLAVICETAMGTKLDEKNKEQTKYLKALYGFGPSYIHRLLSPILYNDTVFQFSPPGWKHFSIVKTLHNFTNRIIQQRETDFNDSDVSDLDNNNEDGVKRKRLAMLDLLISAKKHRNEIDDEGIREEVDTFMFEGHDTTSMALCFALMVLSRHKDVQDKIITEMDEIFGDDERPASYEDLQNMKYLEMCIKESLRLYPSVPIVSRVLREDTQLTHHVAPAGCTVVIHIYDIHRDPKVFPDPEKFDPERFLPENCKGRNPYAYIPFSAGPRNCIGQKFAMLEMKSTLSAIFRNFTLEAVNIAQDLNWTVDLVLRTNSPIYVNFKPREK